MAADVLGKQARASLKSGGFSPAELFGLLVPLLAIAAHVGLFVLGKFPSHAMGLRYLTVYLPILVVAAAPLLRNALQDRAAVARLATAGIAAAMLLASNILFWAEQERQSASEQAESELLASPAIITDTVKRGLLPRYVWNQEASDGQAVIASTPALLPQVLAQIADTLPARVTVVHSTYYPKDAAGMAKSLAELVVQYGYRCEAAHVFDYGELSLCHRSSSR